MTTYTKAGRVTGRLEPVPSYDEYLAAWRAMSLAYVGVRHWMDRRAGMDVMARIPDHIKHEYTIKRLRAAEDDFAAMGMIGPEAQARNQRVIELMEQGTEYAAASFQAKEEHKARTREWEELEAQARETRLRMHRRISQLRGSDDLSRKVVMMRRVLMGAIAVFLVVAGSVLF